MPQDLTVWSPAMGGSGDDKYNLPGGTQLDGSFVDNPIPVKAGDGSFSGSPTLSEVDAANHLNQIAGMINYRKESYLDAFGDTNGFSISSIPYVSIDQKIAGNLISGMTSAITNIRRMEGLSDYSFPSNMSQVGTAIRAFHVAHLRKALGVNGELTLKSVSGVTGYAGWVKASGGAESLLSQTSGANRVVGYVASSSTKRRVLRCFRIPPWLDDVDFIEDAFLDFTYTSIVGSPTLAIRLSNSEEVPLTTAAAGHLDFVFGSTGSFSGGAGTIAWPLDGFGDLDQINRVTDAAGETLCVISATTQELAGATTDTRITNYVPSLVIDLGAA